MVLLYSFLIILSKQTTGHNNKKFLFLPSFLPSLNLLLLANSFATLLFRLSYCSLVCSRFFLSSCWPSWPCWLLRHETTPRTSTTSTSESELPLVATSLASFARERMQPCQELGCNGRKLVGKLAKKLPSAKWRLAGRWGGVGNSVWLFWVRTYHYYDYHYTTTLLLLQYDYITTTLMKAR